MLSNRDDELLAKFEENLSQRALSSSTIVNYLADLRAFKNWVNRQNSTDLSLLSINQQHIRLYRHYLAQELHRAPSTTNRHMMSLRKFYIFATDLGFVPTDPTAGVALVTDTRQTSPRVLSAENIDAMLRSAQNGSRAGLVRRDVAILQLLLCTGLRISEVVDLRTNDLIFENPGVRLQINTGLDHCRHIPVPKELVTVLVDYLNLRPKTGNSHFFLNQDGGQISKRTVQRIVSDCAKNAGLKGVSAQVLRRTYAQQLFDKTQDLPLVSKRLGHQNVAITEQYLAVTK
jgi:site-specific recombinase XerD